MSIPNFPTENEGTKPKDRKPLGVALALLAVGCVVLVGIWRLSLPAVPGIAHRPVEPLTMTPFITPGIRLPPIQKAAEVDLPGETPVIGVAAGGKFRAYRIEAFQRINAHVVNDLIGDAPITVTHCDRTECTNVFTDKIQGAPLRIDLGGYMNKMFLKTETGFFFQDSGESTDKSQKKSIAHSTYPFEKTTWKKWKDAHPDTDIYVSAPKKS